MQRGKKSSKSRNTCIWVGSIFAFFSLFYLWQHGLGSEKPNVPSNATSFTVANSIPESKVPEQYGVVFDLGSSGSRANVFTWKRNIFGDCSVSSSGSFRNLKPIGNKKIKPGISSMANTPEKAAESLQQLWEYLEELVPQEKRSETPIFMFATAGLRVVAEKNNEKLYDDDDQDDNVILESDDDDFSTGEVSNLLENLRDYVRTKSGFSLIRNDHIRVITGTEEGVFDFLTLQQSLRLNPHAKMGPAGDQTNKYDIIDTRESPMHNELFNVGTIDVGGASTQISFVPSGPPFTTTVSAFSGVPVNQPQIYTHSFLDYGINRAYELYIGSLLKYGERTIGDEIVDPCLFSGTSHQVEVNSVLHKILGGGEPVRCKLMIRHMIEQFAGECPSGGCAMKDEIIAPFPSNIRFVAFDHAYRVSSLLKVSGYTPFVTLHDAISKSLSTPWSEVVVEFNSSPSEDVAKLGFEGMYIYCLLQYGYGLDRTDLTLVGFADTIDEQRISWALGAMVYHAKALCDNHDI